MEWNTPITAGLIILATLLIGVPLIQNFMFVNLLRSQITDLQFKMDLFYGILSPRIGSLVKAPTHHELDTLVDAFASNVATMPELLELEKQLGLRAEEANLTLIQQDAIALVLIYVGQRMSGVYTRGTEMRLQGQESFEQVDTQAEMEAQQVKAGERHPPK